MARPKSEDPLIFLRVGLRQSDWDLLRLFKCGDDSPTRQLGELMERVRKFWPNGPEVFGAGRAAAAPRYRAPSSITRYMERHGLTRTEALARIATEYKKLHPEEFE